MFNAIEYQAGNAIVRPSRRIASQHGLLKNR